MGLANGVYPFTAWKVPTYFMGFDGTGAAESGIEVGLRIKGIKADVLLVGGDGGIMDIGLQTVSSALERGHNITYFLYDNEAYMNTGVQRSSGTPYLASTKTTPGGKKEHKKDIMKIAEAHRGVYTATVSPAYPNDLLRKMKKARAFPGPAFIHAICPCSPGWGHASDTGIEICRNAVETGTVVLYEYYEGKRVINRLPKERKPIGEYLKLQGRYSHLTPQQIALIQEEVDQYFNRIVGEAEKGVKELDLPVSPHT
jgi:pyruvate ferredoxin oxidoreductase beta subunit